MIDQWELVEALLSWNTEIGITALRRMDVIPDSVASIWPLFVERLRLVAKRDPKHLSYVAKLVDGLGLENLFDLDTIFLVMYDS